MRYPITFYNAIWLVLFASLILVGFDWLTFTLVFLFCPSWSHVREWHDTRRAFQKDNGELITEVLNETAPKP